MRSNTLHSLRGSKLLAPIPNHHRMKTLPVLLLLGSASASSLSAQVFFNETFDYALSNGASIIGSGGWTNGFGNPGLVFAPSLDGIGGSAVANDGGPYTTATPTGGVNTFFTFRVDASANLTGGRIVFESTTTDTASGYGLNFNYDSATDTLTAFARVGSTNTAGPGVNISLASGPALVFGTFVHSSPTEGQTTLYFNPTDTSSLSQVIATAAATAQTISATWDTGGGGSSVVLRTATTRVFNVDNLVLAGSYSELSAIPEASTFGALAGLGALGFAASRRRRRA